MAAACCRAHVLTHSYTRRCGQTPKPIKRCYTELRKRTKMSTKLATSHYQIMAHRIYEAMHTSLSYFCVLMVRPFIIIFRYCYWRSRLFLWICFYLSEMKHNRLIERVIDNLECQFFDHPLPHKMLDNCTFLIPPDNYIIIKAALLPSLGRVICTS